MAKTRMVNTRFWSDGFIREKLNPLDRYLYLYFLTNDKTNISGIYELPKSIMSWETGIEEKTLSDMLVRLKGKVEYYDGWVILVNFLKYQNITSKDVMKGVEKSLNEAPKHILEYAYSRGYRDCLGTVYRQPEESESKLKPESNTPEPSSEFDLPKELEILKASKRKDLRLVGYYFRRRKMNIPSKAIFQKELKRALAEIKTLKDYEDKKIIEAFNYAESHYPEWTIETVGKTITKI